MSVVAMKKLSLFFPKEYGDEILSKLIKQGLILTGNFNKLGKDRTTWYTLSDKGLSLFNGDFSIVQNCTSHCAELHNPLCENAQPIEK